MSVGGSSARSSNGTESKRQLIQRMLLSMSDNDVVSGDVTRLLLEELQAYNFTLSPAEVAFIGRLLQPLDLGPKRESLSSVVPVTIVYSLIFFTGIIGNICTCVVILRNKYMRTVTNYYLFNLSVSDLLLLVSGLPHEIYSTWSSYPFLFGNTLCRLKFVASEASSYVSILTITAFTVERYVAICHPISVPVHPGFSRPFRVVCLIWFVSTLCAIPAGLQFGIVYKEWRDRPVLESAQCNTLHQEVAKIVFQLSTFLFFVLPMTVISFLYFFIALAVRKSALNRSGSGSSTHVTYNYPGCDEGQGFPTCHQARIRQSVLKMLVAVVVAFFLCWAPFHTQRLLAVYVEDWSTVSVIVHNILFYVSGVTYYLSATINPVLYSIMSLKFRQAFRSTLSCCACCCTLHQPRRHTNKISYTFRFCRRNHIKTHCSVADSSIANSIISNNNSNNNNNNNNGKKTMAPASSCWIGCGNVPKCLDMDQSVETIRGNNYKFIK